MTEDTPLFHIATPEVNSKRPSDLDNNTNPDKGVEEVFHWFQNQKDYQKRFGLIFRRAIDEVLDGQRTGRFDLHSTKKGSQVEKTEKTYLGTKVEIVTRAEFNIPLGGFMDYEISDHQVDAKFTIGNNWTIPKEAVGQICLLMTANDAKGTFQVGLIRVTNASLNDGRNGDQKRTLSASAKKKIRWIIKEGRLPINLLLRLQKEAPEKARRIFEASNEYRGGGNGGQLRVNELFRQVTGTLIDRTTLTTVATQHDGPKRARDARKHLRQEGIVVLGHMQPYPQIARDLNLPVPKNGFWVAARLALIADKDPRPSTLIHGRAYGLWEEGDTPIIAPIIGEQSQAATL